MKNDITVVKTSKKSMKGIYPKSANWRIIIPNLIDYKDSTPSQRNELKCLILQRLKRRPQGPRSHIKSQFDRGLRYYHIALEHHSNGVPHLDILLIYDKSIRRNLTDYDYLLKHGNITTYRKLNQAIIDYGKKEDKYALSNLPEDQQLPDGTIVSQLIKFQEFKSNSYRYLQLQMLQDPLHFNVEQYVRKHDLAQYIKNWSSIKNKLKDMQTAAANLKLKDKPGFKFIDRRLIEELLSPSQLNIFDSWVGYQIIVNYLNQIPMYGCKRFFKSKQLFLVGPANVGKTSLIRQIQKHCAVYHLDVSNWFPNYRDGVYTLLFWDQFKLKGGMSHTDLLKFLQGSPMDLQYKGGSSLRRDNQLIIMTSNMTLNQHINLKFKDKALRSLARDNLRARIEQIQIPTGYDLFILQKLLIPNDLLT